MQCSTSISRLRHIETYQDLCDFCGFLDFFLFLDLDQKIIQFYKYLNGDTFCLHFVLQNWLQNEQKLWEIQIQSLKKFKKSRQNLNYLK